MEIYLVGGAVRDELLGLPVKDRDYVVVGAKPEEMVAKGFKPVGADFPVFLHPETHEEYALARTERKSGRGYKGFTVYAAPDVTLEEDLERRDLTINAMARDEDGRLIDPFGGQADLEKAVLRHVSDAFLEDPVRILRIARFAARFAEYDFHVAHKTNELMREMVRAGEVDFLVPERVWGELEGALASTRPSRFFQVLRGCGALARIFPEIDMLYGVPQPEHHHPEVDTGVHTMMVLDQAAAISDDARVRFAALMHDLGKGDTPKTEWPRHIAHEHRGIKLIEAMCQRFRVPNEYRQIAILTARFHSDCHRISERRPAKIVDLLEGMDAFRKPERIKLFLLACEADARGRKGEETTPYPQAEYFHRLHEAAMNVDTASIARSAVEAGIKGEAIGERVRAARIEAVKTVYAKTS